ncbi:RagB/SusD domain-containing protein [Hallella multisaccharivorax DSM 17128]|uniref:RagB/SusD domain-containing protein n=1 Tax=Hallella multisaccharivorax DSM 17128 TaxID=688246 RepID=F8N7F7_9BACT|nr:RagB/SusD family nutrient uptake outer membrane protein [Hallella multisaccharivorax]EGN56384.1 RagB/SusD domain-containing protein [Hallella multisaccharivorax DSM 17128]
MKNNKFTIFCGIVLGGLTLSSCQSDFLDTVPTNRVSTKNVWKTENLANSVVNGAYERFYYELIGNEGKGLDEYTEICDLDVNWASNDCPLALGTATSSSGIFEFWWRCFYEEIYRTSNVIQNIDKVPDMSDSEKDRDKAECCVLRAWAYARANAFWRGVPVYTEPVAYGEATKPRSSEGEVWKQVIEDCTTAINSANLPDKYSTSDANYGRVTKGAAYYLRGQAYLWLKDYGKAESDFRAVTKMGYSLYPDYKAMFKAANEKNDEYIFQYQYTDDSGLGNWLSQCYGNRVTVDNAWNNYIPNPKFVDSYTWANGKPFDMDDVIPGYSKMDPVRRSVYFLRDSLGVTTNHLQSNYKKGYEQMKEYGSDMDKYLPYGNEARIKKVYEGRDPRMGYNFILPYSGYVGGCTANNYTYYLRWPYFGSDNSYPFDLRTDTNDKYYYMWRKFVIEGRESKTIWDSDIDIPVFRYAGALLSLAEALNEQGKTDEAITYVNQVRARIPGLALLNSNEYTKVTGKENMRKRIRDEWGWEFAGEMCLYFKELRWGTWADKKFGTNRGSATTNTLNGANGMTEIWGSKRYTLIWPGDYCEKWAVPQSEIERNPNLTQNDKWN